MESLHFKEHTIANTNIKVVSGTILAQDNGFTSEYDLFYWANFVPHFTKGHFFIIGECGFDLVNEKTKFFFEYAEDTDTVTIKDYRLSVCSPEVSARYYLHIKYGTPRKEDTIVIPWKRFPRTKDGISVPQLIEQIFGRIPTVMFFL
jgi:hypothetical protein